MVVMVVVSDSLRDHGVVMVEMVKRTVNFGICDDNLGFCNCDNGAADNLWKVRQWVWTEFLAIKLMAAVKAVAAAAVGVE